MPDERQFFLFDSVRQRIASTGSWDEFIAALRELPDGIEVERFNTCCAPCDYAMPDRAHEELETVRLSKRIAWRPDPSIGRPWTLVCTCESTSRGNWP